MTEREHAPGYVPNQNYTQDDWDEVSDNPKWTPEDFARARPAAEMFPTLAASMRGKRGPQKMATKQLISLRLDRRIIDHFRATGDGWQTRLNDALLKAAGLS